MKKVKKLSPAIYKSLLIPLILIAIAIVSLLQLIPLYFGYTAYILVTLLIVFIPYYRKIISVKNWLVRSMIGYFIVSGITAFLNQSFESFFSITNTLALSSPSFSRDYFMRAFLILRKVPSALSVMPCSHSLKTFQPLRLKK